jgi:hypothetical protein
MHVEHVEPCTSIKTTDFSDLLTINHFNPLPLDYHTSHTQQASKFFSGSPSANRLVPIPSP